MKKINMAVLITCHNRIQKTQTCLKSLFKQKKIENINLKVFLVDDGSVDGTKEHVNINFPQVNLIDGNGQLYWGGGTFLAWETALEDNIEYDYFLWVNDDTFLFEDAISILLASKKNEDDIITGSICDPITKKRTYGGAIFNRSFLRPLKYNVVDINGKPQEIDTINGNAVLIPLTAFKKIGKFDKDLTHLGGDLDYSLRARKLDIKIFLTPSHIGTCKRLIKKYNANSLLDEIKNIFNIKTHPPIKFYMKHGGILWPLHFFMLYIKSVINVLFKHRYFNKN
jgi:GT2 family glycosyltransferase